MEARLGSSDTELDLQDTGFRRVIVPDQRMMSAFNPIASMQRLEAGGFKRVQAEALADELRMLWPVS